METIKNDYKLIEFGEIVEVRKEKMNPIKLGGNVKCIELEHLDQISGKINGWTDASSQKSIKNIFQVNNVLFGKLRPYLRKYWLANFDGVCSSEIWVLKPKNKKITSEFLFNLVQTDVFIQTSNVSSGSKMPRADWNYVASRPFLIPPLPEQKAIADCLATWDKAIESQAQLIKTKETRKKALMQQLLTGKKRLPGFTEEWKEVKLGDLFSERNEVKILDLPLLSIGQEGVYPQTDSNKRDISNADKSKYKRIIPGDIGYNTMRMWQGRSALSSLEGIVSPAYTILKPKENVNSYYFSILFKTSKLTNLFWRNSQGLVDDTLNCKYKDFSKIKYRVPSFEEQNAIAAILNTTEKEIQIENQKLVALQEQKKGMMQQLLTGKVRLIQSA